MNEKEAAIVRLIYQLFLEGKTPAGICRYLDAQSVPTPAGKTKWSQTTVNSILSNEKYKGDALLQKKFTVDFLMKKTKTNEGEVPQYYVEHSHEAIINPTECSARFDGDAGRAADNLFIAIPIFLTETSRQSNPTKSG